MKFFSKENENKRAAIGEGIYLLYFAVMIGARAAGLYEGMLAYNILLVLGLLLFACKYIVTLGSIKEVLVAGFLFAIAGLVYLNTGEKGLLVCFTMLLGMKYVHVKKVIGTGILVSGVLIIGKILLGITGILPEIYYPQKREGIGLMFRHALGYAHPNTLHMNVLMLTMLIIFFVTSYVVKDNIKLLLAFSALAILFNLYIFQYSGSRTGIVTSTVYVLINLWFYIRKKPGLPEKILCYASYPAVCFIAIAGPFVLPESIFGVIDKKVFTTRLTIARYFWENNGVSLFGIRLVNPVQRYRTYGIDMAHLYLFLQLGIVAFLLISFMTMAFIHFELKKERMQELAVLMGMLCLGIWEPLLYNLGYKNFVYVFMGALLFELLGTVPLPEKDRDGEVKTILLTKAVMRAMALGIATGVAASFIYLLLTTAPTALYGDKQNDEAGTSFGMEKLFFTPDEIDELKSNGEIVIGYVDETKALYKYDSDIATMEYQKRVISVGAWTFIIVAALYGICYTRLDNFRTKD